MNGGVKLITGKSVILATGGVGRLYRATTNAYACTGDGMSMALHEGLPLKDIEFMQFHPTTMYPSGILITEGCRGEGGYLINKTASASCSTRPERARACVARRRLPLRDDRDRSGPRRQRLRLPRPPPPRPREDPHQLPGSRELAMTYAGVDPIDAPIPVRPGAHYHMGGVTRRTTGAHGDRGPVRRRRGRLRLRARRQPPRRQLADGDDRVRPTLGRRRGRYAIRVPQRPGLAGPPAAVRDDERTLRAMLRPRGPERPWKLRESWRRHMHDKAASSAPAPSA